MTNDQVNNDTFLKGMNIRLKRIMKTDWNVETQDIKQNKMTSNNKQMMTW